MIDALLAGLLNILTGTTLLFMVLGVVIGFVVGLLPGLGGAVALAVLVPFTFDMETGEAFAFLLGMLAATGTTGDITATIFGVPGESTSAANILDGFPMTKKGQGGRALGAVLTSSAVGGIFGAVVLAVMIPFVRPLVLELGSPEFFALIVVGLMFIAALGRGAMLKALIAALGGLMLAMIGLDPHTGIPRFTFGWLLLWDGPGLVAVAIGLFAVPELLDVSIRKTSLSSSGRTDVSGLREGVRDTIRHRWLLLRCSALGSIIGILPGLGAAVAQWVAYSHAVQTSPRYDADGNERFGHGAIEGVIGPGAANNSKDGGGLVPTIVFGVPGSLTAAILLGAFTLHGLTPGREMLTTHLDLTMSFVSIIVIANIMAVAFAVLWLRPIVRLTEIRTGLMVPPLLFLIMLGAYASAIHIGAILIMLLFGLLGIAMVLLRWPRPPLVLGLVLGPLAENYFTRSVERYGLDWLTFPSVLGLFGLALVVLLYPFVSDRVKRRGGASPSSVGGER